LLAFVIFAAWAIVHQRWWAASWLLGVPVFIKVWPLAVVLLLIACWPKKLFWRFAIVFLVLAAVPFLTRPPLIVFAQYKQWFFSLIAQDQGRWAGFRDSWTIWENLGLPIYQKAYVVTQFISSLPVLAWCLYQCRRIENLPLSHWERPLTWCPRVRAAVENNSPIPDASIQQILYSPENAQRDAHLLTLILSSWACWQLLFGPGSEQLTYGLIAPSAAWAMLTSFDEKKHRIWTTLNWLIPALLGCGEIETPLINLHPAFAMLLPLSVISFVVWLVCHER